MQGPLSFGEEQDPVVVDDLQDSYGYGSALSHQEQPEFAHLPTESKLEDHKDLSKISHEGAGNGKQEGQAAPGLAPGGAPDAKPGQGSSHHLTSFTINQQRSDEDGVHPQQAQDNPPPLVVKVHSPTKVAGQSVVPGVDEVFVMYELTTSTSLPQYKSPHFTVKRRFKDVVALAKLLPRLYQGCVLPARPSKNLVEGRRMNPQFVDDRRAAIERYMNRLAAHPVVGRSEVLQVFLEVDGQLRQHPSWKRLKPRTPNVVESTGKFFRKLVGVQMPTPTEVTQSASASRDVYRMLREQVASLRVSSDAGLADPREEQLRDATGLLEDLKIAMLIATQKADAYVRSFSEVGQAMGELAGAFNAWYRLEQTYHFLPSQPVSVLAQGCGQARNQNQECADQLTSCLVTLHEYHHTMPNVLHALQQREKALLTCLTVQQDLETKQARTQVVEAQPNASLRRVDTLRQQSSLLDTSLSAARGEYERICERNVVELEAFQRQRSRELLQMVKEFAELQRDHALSMATGWEQVAGALGEPTVVTSYMAQKNFTPWQ